MTLEYPDLKQTLDDLHIGLGYMEERRNVFVKPIGGAFKAGYSLDIKRPKSDFLIQIRFGVFFDEFMRHLSPAISNEHFRPKRSDPFLQTFVSLMCSDISGLEFPPVDFFGAFGNRHGEHLDLYDKQVRVIDSYFSLRDFDLAEYFSVLFGGHMHWKGELRYILDRLAEQDQTYRSIVSRLPNYDIDKDKRRLIDSSFS